jgi:Ca2+-binding RTX toxin-like protein
LRGGSGVDTLFGADGRDSLFGDANNDILIGGLGGDFLTGGADADTFGYNKLTDSGITAGTRDQIFDFVHAADEIDLGFFLLNDSVSVYRQASDPRPRVQLGPLSANTRRAKADRFSSRRGTKRTEVKL